MESLKNKAAALGFICFFSLALLPVSMTVCGPFTSRLLHHAKKARHIVHPAPAPEFGGAQPDRATFERDVIPEEGDPVRSLLEHTGIARSPAGIEPEGPKIRPTQGMIRGAKVSTFVFQSVLNL